MSALLLDSPNLPDLSPLKKHEQLTSMLIQALEHHTCRQVFEAPLGQYLLEHFALAGIRIYLPQATREASPWRLRLFEEKC